MAAPTLGAFLQRLRKAMTAEALAGRSDRELVEQFRDGLDEAAFAAILERHGPMVLQVCRRVLSSPADVEDAFQATFLILIRRGHTIRRQSSLASWLHGVARRTALKLRTQAARRRQREQHSAAAEAAVSDDTTWGELRGVLDEELQRLPESLRTPLLLCYLEGRTQDEAAAQLSISKSTLRRNLERARERLGQRLARRGAVSTTVFAARLVSDACAGAAVPHELLLRTAESARHTVTASAASASVLPARVTALTDGVIRTMHYAKCKTVVAMLACCLVLGFGVHHFGLEPANAQDKNPGPRAQPPAAKPDIEPIDPDLVFDGAVQKQLRLSKNQIEQLFAARERGTKSADEQTKRVAELDARLKSLQKEMDRLHEEQSAAQRVINKAQTDQVKAALPKFLSNDALHQLRQLTLQRMSITDVLLDPRVRARLDLNDEQLKKIHELRDKPGGLSAFRIALADEFGSTVQFTNRLNAHFDTAILSNRMDDQSRAELLKVLTPQQRDALERLSGHKLNEGK